MALTPGGSLNSVPSHQKQTLSTNYLDFTATTTAGWAQQYLPDLMAQESEVFGPRTISGFLASIGAEEPMMSDQVIWSEQGRLHLSYKATLTDLNGGSLTGGRITITQDIDNTAGFTATNHGIRVNDTLLIATAAGTMKAIVQAASAGSAVVDVAPYGAANLTTLGNEGVANAVTVLVYGSEFAKATNGRAEANEPQFQSFSNKPIILKDYYEISGSDAGAIGWVETSSEDGTAGYMWYVKAESDTRMRFADYLEMSLLESEAGVPGTDFVDDYLALTGVGTAVARTGTEGLFAAIESRGNTTNGITGASASVDFAEFDTILAEFDRQGAIEEYMIFCNRQTSLALDDMLASLNSGYSGGASYGVFSNSEGMALNLGFMGFRRASYDFYKSDFRYLNDKATRGSINDANTTNSIRGMFIPAGVSTVYDQMLGKNMMRPFLHVRYRVSTMEDRYMKTWVTGGVGAATSSLDAMQLHYLSERCLVTQGANNFMLMR
jgi:hypothetical protein